MIRTRFAPSPTGFLHVGGLRTALYNYLFAKSQGGQFLLRIEDTDQERTVAGGVENILSSLYWAKIIPEEGVVMGQDGKISEHGKYGPYRQSNRLAIYHQYAKELVDNGHAYYCFCDSKRLDELREQQQKNKRPTGYDGFCLKNIEVAEARRRVEAGERHVIRLKMPKSGETKFNDLIRGEVIFKNSLIDDQVLIKSDGFPTYHLAVVVDDHLMAITHVIRGEEWISSTPKHLQLYSYFGWQPPAFAHLPLLLNSDKSKLSKRQGDVAVADYKGKGYLPEALINFVAFLGWNPGGEQEIFSLAELVKNFKIERVNKTGAVFNLEKLDWYNREYLKKTSPQDIFELIKDQLSENQKNFSHRVIQAIALEKDRIAHLDELMPAIKFIFVLPDYEGELLVWKKSLPAEAKEVLADLPELFSGLPEKDWDRTIIEKAVINYINEKKLPNGSVLWPLRVALSGQENSPGPFEIAEVLGKDESIIRLKTAHKKIV